VLEIAAAEDLLMGLIRSQVMSAPARTEPEDVKALDELIVKQIRDRSRRRRLPSPSNPLIDTARPKRA